MWRVKIQRVGKGLHPSEFVVEVQTLHGNERLVVDRASIHGNSLFVGSPIEKKKGQFLVELPRETMSGTWRVWVKQNQIFPERESVGAA